MKRCPSCGKFTSARIPSTPPGKIKRMCSACNEPILRGHKWFLNAQQRCQHRCCEEPEFRSVEEAMESKKPKPSPLFDGVSA